MTHIPHPVTIDQADGSRLHRCPIDGCPWEHRQPARRMIFRAWILSPDPTPGEDARKALETHIGWHTPLEWAQAIAVVRHDLERARDALRRLGVTTD